MIDDGTAAVSGYSLFGEREGLGGSLPLDERRERIEVRAARQITAERRAAASLPQPFLDIKLAQQGHLQEDGLQKGGLHPFDFGLIAATGG